MTLVPWLAVALLLVAALPWAFVLLANGGRRPDWPLSAAVALATAFGTLTLVMFVSSLVGIAFDSVILTAVTLGVMAVGAVVWLRQGRPLPPAPRLDRWSTLAWLLLVAVSAAILFNAAYWPFSRDDALGIYHAQAQALADSRALLPLTGADSLYLTYAPLMPLAYAYTYLLSGWEHEYLARAVSALLALGALPAAYALGREVGGRTTGLLAALVVALTPTFGRWASAGYVDLPAAYFIMLSAIFALRLYRNGAPVDALLAGASMGLAAWTKNAALINVAVLGLWLVGGVALRRFGWRTALVALLACGLVAGPWYARNWLGAGFLVPDTAWTDEARPTLETLLLFVTRPQIYGLVGWLLLGGVALCLLRLVRSPYRAEAGLLLLWTGPFFGAWWLLTSYDPRLLLPVVPVFAVMAGWLLASGWQALTPRHRPTARLAATLVALVLTAVTLWNSVEFKDEILRDPLMSDADKHALVLAGRNQATGD